MRVCTVPGICPQVQGWGAGCPKVGTPPHSWRVCRAFSSHCARLPWPHSPTLLALRPGEGGFVPPGPMLFASSQTCCRISLAVREATFLNQCPRGSLLCCLQEVPSSLGFCVSWVCSFWSLLKGLSWGFTLESWSSLN